MRRKFSQRSARKQRMGLRTLMYVGSFCIAVLLFVSVIVVTFFKNEESSAVQNPMVITGITSTQDTTSLNKGTHNAAVLCIIVSARGNANKLVVTSMELASRGTTKPVNNLVENARLWYTGNENHFSTNRQLGATIAEIPDGNFTVSARQPLQPGDNYFWLTYDITSPSQKKMVVDAECINVKIGTLTYEPDIASPAGAKKVNDNYPFYSTGNSDISSLKSWNTKRDASGANPESFNSLGATFHIQSGHIMQNTLNACIQSLIVERNGVLRSASAINADLLEVHAGGLYIQETEMVNPSKLKKLVISNNGNYLHNNIGMIPGHEHNFDKHATVTLKTIGKETLSKLILWGNLVIDSDLNDNTNLSESVRIVKGNLEIRNTGKVCVQFLSSDTISIGGNLVIDGGNIQTSPNGNHVVLNIGNQLVVNNGSIMDGNSNGNLRGGTTIHIGKSCSINSDGFQFISQQSGVVIKNSETTWFQKTENAKLPGVILTTNSSLILLGNYFGSINKGREIIVMEGATLHCENALITGEGNFILENFATISTGHIEGLHSNERMGTVQTADRYFSSDANYRFTGGVSPQRTGIFNTQPIPNTVKNIEVTKSFIGNILILQQPFYYTGSLILQRGNINKNNNPLQPQTTEASLPMLIPSASVQ